MGKIPNDEVVSNPYPSQEMRPSGNMQGGYIRDLEVYDGVQAGMGGVHGPTEDNGMEHDGDNIIDV